MKTIKRIPTVKGEFTTVNYNLLRDKNLTPIAKLLLIEILSDNDNFTLSQTVYCNRLGISKGTWFNVIKNLIDNGYIKKEKKLTNSKGIYYNYIVSEYGDLIDSTTHIIAEKGEKPKIIQKPIPTTKVSVKQEEAVLEFVTENNSNSIKENITSTILELKKDLQKNNVKQLHSSKSDVLIKKKTLRKNQGLSYLDEYGNIIKSEIEKIV